MSEQRREPEFRIEDGTLRFGDETIPLDDERADAEATVRKWSDQQLAGVIDVMEIEPDLDPPQQSFLRYLKDQQARRKAK